VHRLHHHSHELVIQCVEVRLIPELGGEGFEGLSSVVLPAIETPVYKGLQATSQRSEQGGDGQGGGDDRKLRLLTCEGAEKPLEYHDAARIHRHQHHGEGTVDKRTIDQEVYLVETIAQDGNACGNGYAGEASDTD
jgi:hypothetical protein